MLGRPRRSTWRLLCVWGPETVPRRPRPRPARSPPPIPLSGQDKTRPHRSAAGFAVPGHVRVNCTCAAPAYRRQENLSTRFCGATKISSRFCSICREATRSGGPVGASPRASKIQNIAAPDLIRGPEPPGTASVRGPWAPDRRCAPSGAAPGVSGAGGGCCGRGCAAAFSLCPASEEETVPHEILQRPGRFRRGTGTSRRYGRM